MTSLSVKFVSRKISKVKWRSQSSSVFVTGSWDDKDNTLCVWCLPSSPLSKDSSLIAEGSDPQLIAEIPFPGSVTDLKVTINDLILASSANGSVHMYKYANENIEHRHSWERIHNFPKTTASVTGIAVKGNDVVSVGEDGKLCIFDFNKFLRVKHIENSDGCALTAVSFLRHHEVATGNSLGYLKTWDLRSMSGQPTHTLMIPGNQGSVTAVNTHPTQLHVLATGHRDGSLCIWDLRQNRNPTTLLAGHSAGVTDILFHPINPEYLFTSSLDGSVWRWNASSVKSGAISNAGDMNDSLIIGNPWLNCDSSKHKVDILSLFPRNSVSVNSLDINDSTLLWGTDNEAVYILPGLIV